MATDTLTTAGAKVIVGVGYCGALQPGIACGDLIIATGVVRDEGTTSHYVSLGFPAVVSALDPGGSRDGPDLPPVLAGYVIAEFH